MLKEQIPISARELSKGFYTPEQTESAIKYIFGMDTQLISAKTYYVAELGGQIVGCGGVSSKLAKTPPEPPGLPEWD